MDHLFVGSPLFDQSLKTLPGTDYQSDEDSPPSGLLQAPQLATD